MMIEALMYGFIASPTIDSCESPPPANRSRMPNAELFLKKSASAARSMPGSWPGIGAEGRPPGVGHLEDGHGPAGGLDLGAGTRAERVRDDEQRRRQVAAATQDLHRPVEPAHEACGAQDLLVDRDRRGRALLR